MKMHRFIMMGSALLMLTGCQHMPNMGGGDGIPTVTRTGEVKDVVIREDLSPQSLSVNPGDEIRWINKRQGNVRVVFLTPVMEMMSCQRNFGGFMGANRNQYTASLSPNETASICFQNQAEIKYVVRADSNLPGGEQNIAGNISVSGNDRAARQATSQPRSAQAEQDSGNR